MQALTNRIRRLRPSALLTMIALAGCSQLHTPESTADLTTEELAALCADLEIRASQQCRWDRQDESVPVTDRQTWEINCEARRDAARQSYDNVCQPPRYRRPDSEK